MFGPSGILGTNLVEVYSVMLQTKYQGSRPYGLRQEDFCHGPYISLCKTCDRGWGHFLPQGYNLNNL